MEPGAPPPLPGKPGRQALNEASATGAQMNTDLVEAREGWTSTVRTGRRQPGNRYFFCAVAGFWAGGLVPVVGGGAFDASAGPVLT